GGRVEVGANQTLGRACLLHFRNQCIVAVRKATLESRTKAARRRGDPGVGFKARKRTGALGRRDLLALIGLDPGENVRHHPFDTASNRSSAPSASPVSIDLFAKASPCFRSLAASATTSAAAALSIATSRNGPDLPRSTCSRASALAAASPPRKAS